MTTQAIEIEQFPVDDNALALVIPTTGEKARVMALNAIATPATIERRDILIRRARGITTITSDEQVEEAKEIAALLKGMRNDVEKSRVAIKAPVLAISDAIDSVAKEVKTEAEAEMSRIEREIGAHLQRKEADRKAELRKQEEIARRERERIEREAEAARAEEAKRQKEAEEIAAKADAGEVSFEEALAAGVKAEEAAAAAAEAAAQAPAVFAPIAPREEKLKGSAVAQDWDYEITNITELYRAKPECVELKPRASVIKAAIKAAAQVAGNNHFTIPGLIIRPKTKVAVRAK